MGKINTILNENRHTILYTRFGEKNRVCSITTVVKVWYLMPNLMPTVVKVLASTHFNDSRYTTHTIFFPKSGIRYRMPIFIQNRIDLAHRVKIQPRNSLMRS